MVIDFENVPLTKVICVYVIEGMNVATLASSSWPK
jgi:hypothetical protein